MMILVLALLAGSIPCRPSETVRGALVCPGNLVCREGSCVPDPHSAPPPQLARSKPDTTPSRHDHIQLSGGFSLFYGGSPSSGALTAHGPDFQIDLRLARSLALFALVRWMSYNQEGDECPYASMGSQTDASFGLRFDPAILEGHESVIRFVTRFGLGADWSTFHVVCLPPEPTYPEQSITSALVEVGAGFELAAGSLFVPLEVMLRHTSTRDTPACTCGPKDLSVGAGLGVGMRF